MTTEGQSQNQREGQEGNEKLFAGKFKTVEELETGYKNSLPVFQENENLKKKLDEVTKIPDEYITPTDVALSASSLEEIKKMAKNSGLTQDQYNKLALETNSRVASQQQSFEAAKKEMGADNINLLQEFTNKYYGEKIGGELLKAAIVNKDIRAELMATRTAVLNSSAPGVGRVGGVPNHAVTKEDVMKARTDMESARGKARIDLQNKYINLQRQYAHQQAAS